jgi:hypothetical protein
MEEETKPQIKTDPPKTPQRFNSLFAAAGTGASSLLFYMFTEIQNMQYVISDLESTQNSLISDEGTIRPSTSAIRSEIRLEALMLRLERLERFYLIDKDD